MTTLSRLWIFVLTLSAGLLALALVLLAPDNGREGELRLRTQLGQASAALLLENQAHQLVAAVSRMASDAVLQTGLEEMTRGQAELDMLHKTAQNRLRELVKGLSAAFVLITDSRGRVLARVGQDEAVYRDALDGWPVLAAALRGYRLDDLWLQQGTLYRVAGAPIVSNGAASYVGAVVIGQVVGNDLASAVRSATALDAVFAVGGKAVGTATSRPLSDALLTELLALRPAPVPGKDAAKDPAKDLGKDPSKDPGKDSAKDKTTPPAVRTVAGHDDLVGFVELPGSAASQGAVLLLYAEGQAGTPLLARLQAAAARGLDPRWLGGLILAVVAAFAVGLLLLRGEVEAPLGRLEALVRRLALREAGPYAQAAPQIHEVPTAGLRPLVLGLNDLLQAVHKDAVTARPVPDLPPLPELPAERISAPPYGYASGPVTPVMGAAAPSQPHSALSAPTLSVQPSPSYEQHPAYGSAGGNSQVSGVSSVPESGEPTRAASFNEETRVTGGEEGRGEGDPELGYYRVYQEFVLARERCNESVEGLNFEQFRKRLEQSRSDIIGQHRCHTVDFQVHIRDGRAMLRATPIWL